MPCARGKCYYYFHPKRGTASAGTAIRIRGEPVNMDGSLNAAWWEDYQRVSGAPRQVSKAGTFNALVEAYRASPEWKALFRLARARNGSGTSVLWS